MALRRLTRRQNSHFITERPLPVNHGAHLARSGDRAVALRRLRRRRIEADDLIERLHRFAAGREDLHARVVAEARAGRDEPADDDVLLQTAQVVGLAGDGRLGEHARRLLERRRRDEAVRRERRLRDAEEHGLGGGRPLALADHALVLLLEHELVDQLTDHELGVADLLDAHAPQHLAHDDLDVLVVDAHALQAIDLLHLVDEVALQLAVAEHGQIVVRVRRAVHQGLARLHAVALVDADVLAARDQVLLGLAVVGADHDLPHALDESAHLHASVDLRDDRLLLRLARLEQLGHARQTAGDVLGLGRLAGDLRDDVGRGHVDPIGHVEVGAHRQRVAVPLGARRLRRVDDDAGLQAALGVLDDDLAREAGDLVELLAHGHAFHDVLVLHLARELGEDGIGERIPLDQHRALLDLLLRLDLQLGAVHDRVALALPPALVGHADLAVAVGGHEVAVAVHDRPEIVELHHAGALRLVLGRLDDAAGRAADVERPHGELRAGLADGLRGDDAHRLAQLGQAAGAEVTAIAEHADTALGVAGEAGTDPHALEARVLDLLRRLLDDLVVGLHDDLARQRIADVFRGHAAEDAVPERLDDVTALDERCGIDVLHGAAVVLADDHVLRDVHQAPREVAGVGRLQRRVGQTLAGAVSRGEVLENGQALAEVRRDRRLDDLARGLGHETAHAGQLADLLLAAPRAGVGHHVDRVELAALLAALELAEHLLRDELGGVRPDVDDLVVALAVGDDAILVLLLDLVHLLARLGDVALLRRRDVHVVDADRQPGQRRVPEAEVLQLVEELDGRLVAEHVHAAADQRGDLLLLQLLVHEAQGLGDHLVEQRAAHRRLEELAVPAQADPRLEIDVLVVVGDPHFLGVGEQAALAAHRTLRRAEPLLGQVVDAEDHVLRGHR